LDVQTNHYDSDERYMALHDICQDLLSKDNVPLDHLSEKRLVAAILDRLEKDTINDVKAISVKALGYLVKRVGKDSNEEIASRLLKSLFAGDASGQGKEDANAFSLRDVFAIGLKNLIADAPASQGPSITGVIVPSLITGLQDKRQDVKTETLELTTAILNRFGNLVDKASSPTSGGGAAGSTLVGGAPAGFLYGLLEHALRLLLDPAQPVRKRAVNVVGALSVYLSDSQLDTCIKLLLGGIEAQGHKKGGAASSSGGSAAASSAGPLAAADPRVLIQTISAVSRCVGWRLASHLSRIVPLFLSEMGNPRDEDEASHTEKENELRENVLQAFDSFVVRSPKVIQPFLKDIVSVSLAWLRYDPNYAAADNDNDDDIAGGGSSAGMDDEEEDEYDDGEGWDDGDDFGGAGDEVGCGSCSLLPFEGLLSWLNHYSAFSLHVAGRHFLESEACLREAVHEPTHQQSRSSNRWKCYQWWHYDSLPGPLYGCPITTALHH
jgi:cullin-associated NEDD8-dissociated protein 1